MRFRPRQAAGFTLTELAIVLIIVALMVGGLLISVSTTRDIADTGEVQKKLVNLQEALLGYAAVHGRLPCPDTDQDGSENQGAPITVNNAPAAGQSQVTTPCTSEEGLLPHREIGLPPGDVWNNRFRYRVTAAFARKVDTFDALNGGGTRIRTGGIDLGAVGNITINTRGDNPVTAGIESKFISSLTVQAPAVLISHGRNSYGATPVNGPARPAPPAANEDETTNATDGQTKWTRTLTGVSNVCSDSAGVSALCEFDDVIHWISPNLIFNRLITAGRLP